MIKIIKQHNKAKSIRKKSTLVINENNFEFQFGDGKILKSNNYENKLDMLNYVLRFIEESCVKDLYDRNRNTHIFYVNIAGELFDKYEYPKKKSNAEKIISGYREQFKAIVIEFKHNFLQ